MPFKNEASGILAIFSTFGYEVVTPLESNFKGRRSSFQTEYEPFVVLNVAVDQFPTATAKMSGWISTIPEVLVASGKLWIRVAVDGAPVGEENGSIW